MQKDILELKYYFFSSDAFINNLADKSGDWKFDFMMRPSVILVMINQASFCM